MVRYINFIHCSVGSKCSDGILKKAKNAQKFLWKLQFGQILRLDVVEMELQPKWRIREGDSISQLIWNSTGAPGTNIKRSNVEVNIDIGS